MFQKHLFPGAAENSGSSGGGELVTVTSSSLTEAGIKTQLDQNDLIEIVVSESFKKFEEELESLNNQGIALTKKCEKIREDYRDRARKSFAKTIKKPLEKIEVACIDFPARYPGYKSPVTHIKKERRGRSDYGAYELFIDDRYTPTRFKTMKLLVSFTESVTDHRGGGVQAEKYLRLQKDFKFEEVPKSLWEELEVEIEAHNKAVKKFVESHPGTISQTATEKQIRTKLNKNILKSQAPEIKRKIEQLFGLSL